MKRVDSYYRKKSKNSKKKIKVDGYMLKGKRKHPKK